MHCLVLLRLFQNHLDLQRQLLRVHSLAQQVVAQLQVGVAKYQGIYTKHAGQIHHRGLGNAHGKQHGSREKTRKGWLVTLGG